MTVKEDHSGHRWGWVSCPTCEQRLSVWGTPRSPGNHGKQIDKFIARHRHEETP